MIAGRNTGKSDNLTNHFTNIEIHTCMDTFFLMFQELGGNGSTVNLMSIIEKSSSYNYIPKNLVFLGKNTQEK